MFDFSELKQNKSRALVMGILNITPDSFYDGGEFFLPKMALERARGMMAEGADIIDIGACSTAPKNPEASLNDELARLKAVLPLITNELGVPVSIDTKKTEVVRFALENGAVIVNDENGCFSEDIAALVKSFGAGWVFMHTGGGSSEDIYNYKDGVVSDVIGFFNEMRCKAVSYGINERCLCYDYGIGFGKSREDDLTLINETSRFIDFNPLLVGASRKRFVGDATGKIKAEDRLYGSVSVAAVAAYNGAGILRVHDVKETVDAVKMVDAIKKGGFNNG